MSSDQQQLGALLKNLIDAIDGIKAAAIVDKERSYHLEMPEVLREMKT